MCEWHQKIPETEKLTMWHTAFSCIVTASSLVFLTAAPRQTCVFFVPLPTARQSTCKSWRSFSRPLTCFGRQRNQTLPPGFRNTPLLAVFILFPSKCACHGKEVSVSMVRCHPYPRFGTFDKTTLLTCHHVIQVVGHFTGGRTFRGLSKPKLQQRIGARENHRMGAKFATTCLYKPFCKAQHHVLWCVMCSPVHLLKSMRTPLLRETWSQFVK